MEKNGDTGNFKDSFNAAPVCKFIPIYVNLSGNTNKVHPKLNRCNCCSCNWTFHYFSQNIHVQLSHKRYIARKIFCSCPSFRQRSSGLSLRNIFQETKRKERKAKAVENPFRKNHVRFFYFEMYVTHGSKQLNISREDESHISLIWHRKVHSYTNPHCPPGHAVNVCPQCSWRKMTLCAPCSTKIW